MSYITPDTTVYLCSGVPIDATYENSIYWTASDSSAQLAYFQSFVSYKLTDYSYQRANKGVLRCGVKTDKLYNVNYMLFQNTAYGSRWFYAFVTSVDYINDNTTDIHYEIDVLQTWWFDITWTACFIERQHSTTDYIGEHLEPEPLNPQDYGYYEPPEAWGFSDLVCIVAVCETDSADVNFVDNNITGANLYAFSIDSEGATALTSLIESHLEDPEAILSMYLAPEVAIYSSDINSGSQLSIYPAGYSGGTKTYEALTANSPLGWKNSNGGTYIPENCKLYTYPYNFFNVTDGNGGSLICPYEFFYQATPVFGSAVTITQPVEALCYPMIYKGSGTAVTSSSISYNLSRYYPEGLTLTDFPMCSWNYDAYKAWIAQNATPISLNILGSIGQSAMNTLSAGLTGSVMNIANSTIGAASNVFNTVINAMSANYSASIAADVSRGTFSNGGVNAASKAKDFFLGRMCIDYYTAVRYDDFFTHYGYALSTFAKPNLCAREYYTYIKTQGCRIVAPIPNDDARKICKIMDNGLTFWNGSDHPSYIVTGYDADNRAEKRGAYDW